MSVSRSHAFALAALAAVLAVVAIAGCGGDGGKDDVATLLEETFDGQGSAVESGKLDLSLMIDLKGAQEGLNQPISIAINGPFENQGKNKVPRFDFSVNLDGGRQQFQAGAISTGNAGYLRLQNQAYDLGARVFAQFRTGYERASKENGAKQATPSFAALGIDPRRWVRDPKEVGTERVGGAETVHVRAGVDVPRLLEDVNRLIRSAGRAGVRGRQVPDELTPTERARAAAALKSVQVDFWTGKEDRTLRKFVLRLDVDVPKSERKRAQLSSGVVELTYAIGDLNRPQRIEEPANARPVAELNAALKALGVGGAGARGSNQTSTQAAPPATTPAPTATTPSASDAYLDCLDAAGDDPAKVSACAATLSSP